MRIQLLVVWIWTVAVCGLAAWTPPEGEDYIPPALTPLPYLIRDPAVREELQLSADQLGRIEKLCERMDGHLFALRDQPPAPKDPEMIEHVRAVVEAMKSLDEILRPEQHYRLQQLGFQFEGVYTLFRAGPAAYLQLSNGQKARMQMIHKQFLQQQELLRERMGKSGEQAQMDEQTRQLRIRFINQFLQVLSEPQRVTWQEMLGKPFDFSKISPLSFRAPELEGTNNWLNSKPLKMKQLRGRVVAVVFWTRNQPDCIGDLPIYKLWARQYDPKEAVIVGIYVPQSEREKDLAGLRLFVQQEGLSFPIAVDSGRAVEHAWTNPMLPSVYLVDKRGRVRWWRYGPLHREPEAQQQASEWIKQLLSEDR